MTGGSFAIICFLNSLLVSICWVPQQILFPLLALGASIYPRTHSLKTCLTCQCAERCWSAATTAHAAQYRDTLPFSPQGYRKLQSVAEQLIVFETLKQNLENSFISHVTSIFELQVRFVLHDTAQNLGD